MTQEQILVLNIIRNNPNFCRNEYELEERTNQLLTDLEHMLPELEARLNKLGPVSDEAIARAKVIISEEMTKVLREGVNASIVKAEVGDKMLSFLDSSYQAFLIYYFQTDRVQPYMATMAVAANGAITFYDLPSFFDDLALDQPSQAAEPYDRDRSEQLCRTLGIPTQLLDQDPKHYFKMASLQEQAANEENFNASGKEDSLKTEKFQPKIRR